MEKTTQPLRATLFPYTTLFRSASKQLEERDRERVLIAPLVHGLARPLLRRHVDRRTERGSGACQLGWRSVVELVGDRKSTRLNSSHVESSYAVFCLKKKTCAVA